MRDPAQDKTLQRCCLRKWRFLIKEYQRVKAKKYPKLRFLSDLYRFHGTSRQPRAKDNNRFKRSAAEEALLPQKRGPRWATRCTWPYIEPWVRQHRASGINRYEIDAHLKAKLQGHTPSPSTLYRIRRRPGVNRLPTPMKAGKRRILKHLAGEWGPIDCPYPGRDLSSGDSRRRYLVCVPDHCTRIARAEGVDDLKSLTVRCSALKLWNLLQVKYRIPVAQVWSDKGAEFASANPKMAHPFERPRLELGIQHRYTRPYRPQTNGQWPGGEVLADLE